MGLVMQVFSLGIMLLSNSLYVCRITPYSIIAATGLSVHTGLGLLF